MAKTKSKSTIGFGRDSDSKRLGIKLHDGEIVKPGNVIIRQRGTKFLPGRNVKVGADDTIYAVKGGKVRFKTVSKIKFDGKKRVASMVTVDSI